MRARLLVMVMVALLVLAIVQSMVVVLAGVLRLLLLLLPVVVVMAMPLARTLLLVSQPLETARISLYRDCRPLCLCGATRLQQQCRLCATRLWPVR
jgi:hypothetical protein